MTASVIKKFLSVDHVEVKSVSTSFSGQNFCSLNLGPSHGKRVVDHQIWSRF